MFALSIFKEKVPANGKPLSKSRSVRLAEDRKSVSSVFPYSPLRKWSVK